MLPVFFRAFLILGPLAQSPEAWENARGQGKAQDLGPGPGKKAGARGEGPWVPGLGPWDLGPGTRDLVLIQKSIDGHNYITLPSCS